MNIEQSGAERSTTHPSKTCLRKKRHHSHTRIYLWGQSYTHAIFCKVQFSGEMIPLSRDHFLPICMDLSCLFGSCFQKGNYKSSAGKEKIVRWRDLLSRRPLPFPQPELCIHSQHRPRGGPATILFSCFC